MSEEALASEAATGISENWLDEHDYLGDDDKKTLSKYTSQEDANKGAANAIRQVGKSVSFPDDKTSKEDRAAFDTKMHVYRGVPDKKEGYEFDRSTIPEHINYDQELEDGLRQLATDKHISKSVAADIHGFYTKMMLDRHGAMEKLAKEAEQGLKDDPDFDFDVKIGKEGGEPGTIKAGLTQLSEQLKMDYKDENGDPQSHLVDALEFIRPNGAIGNMAPLVKAMDYLLNYRYAEGRTDTGDPVAATKTGGEFGTPGFYEHVDTGGAE